jgi:hypothetical protein
MGQQETVGLTMTFPTFPSKSKLAQRSSQRSGYREYLAELENKGKTQ